MKLTGQEQQHLQQALLGAFTINSLKQMLAFKLDKDLDTITTANGFSNIVFDLITTANQEGWISQLITSAKEFVPDNQLFANTSAILLVKLQQKTTIPNNLNPQKEQTYPEETLPQITFKSPQILDVSVDKLRQVAPKVDILLLTVNEWERKALLSEMTPLEGQDSILQGALSAITYRIGMFGNYCAAYTESTMGSGGRHGATLTAERAINELKPKAVFLLGIAFGIDRTKQKLGDVLIAESIFPYELQKVNEAFSIHRGQSVPCGTILSERFRMRRADWQPTHTGQSFDVKVHQGLVLSGEKVVNNKEFRDGLVKAFPTAIGGEMEGAGAYAAAVSSLIEVILIKSICDWADGDKNDAAQPFAAFTAISLAKHVLSKPDVLHHLIPVTIVNQDKVPLPLPTSNQPIVLLSKSNKYIPHDPQQEEQALNKLASHGEPIVIIGAARSGKTTLLYHLLNEFLKQNNTMNITYIYINFLDFIDEIKDFDSLLKNISATIAEKVLPNDAEGHIKKIWNNRFSSPQGKMRTLMKDYILPKIESLFVLVIDEADHIYDRNLHSGFFTMLQSWSKSPEEIWSKFRLMVAISRTRIDLIGESKGSPFNIGVEIVLKEFNEEQVTKLSVLYNLNWTNEQIKQLMAIVGGNPALVDSIMKDAVSSQMPLVDLLNPKKNTSFSPFLNSVKKLLKENPELKKELIPFKDAKLHLPKNLKLCKMLTRFGLLIEKTKQDNTYFHLSCLLYKELLED